MSGWVHFLQLEELLHSAPPSQRFGSSHPAVFGGRWVSPFLGRGGTELGPFGGGRSLGLGGELGPEHPASRRGLVGVWVALHQSSTFSRIGSIQPSIGAGG